MRPAKRQRRSVPLDPSAGDAVPQPPRAFPSLRLLWLAVPAVVAGLAFFISSSEEPLIKGTRQASPFVVRDIPGKGKGVIAIRDIQQGELLMQEPPLFIVPKSISESPTALISRLLNEVSPEGRDAFLNLSYVNFPKGVDPDTHPEEVALAIFQTNAVAAGDGVGIFPHMARLNHGCSRAFNAVYSWRQREQQIFVYALRDIRRGQELLTTYTDTKRTRNDRRAFLSDQYGFLCTCAVCSLDDAASKVSDERLTAISHHYGHFATWGSGKTIDGIEAINTINTIWKLEDEEGYWSERGQLAADAAWIAAAHKDAWAARSWAQLALQWYSYELGADSQLVLDLQATAGHPERHPAWGSREPLTVGLPIDSNID
ncbi:hypothetical protein C8R46DRAFT_1177453 [Mycena filopes]|nr:hypothetical protein C8R46DRAFT_1177453 [Mycena filopes]